MAPKKEDKTEKKQTVKPFKDGSNNWWYNKKHYMTLSGEIKCVAGGISEPEAIEKITAYCKRKKIKI